MLFALLLVALHLYFANEFRAFMNPNVQSRVYLTLAIVDHGTLRIDEYVRRFGATMDMARFGEHFYSDKAPGYSLGLVPLAWIIRRTLVAPDDLRTMSILLRILGLSLPAVAFWLLTWRHWSALAGDWRRGAAVVIAGALGTNFFIYATQLFAHAAAGMLIFAAYLTLTPAVRQAHDTALSLGGRGGAGLWRPAVCGLLLALAFTFDYIVAPAVLVIACWAVFRQGSRRIPSAAALLLAAAPIAAGWMAYNATCFGNPLDVGFRHHADPVYGPAYQRGLWGIQWPNADAILGMTILPARGLLFMSPLLLLAPVGWFRMWRDPALRGRALVSALTVLAIGAFSMTTVDWRGGWSVSVRYLVPAIPFALEGVAAALAQPGPSWTTAVFRIGAIIGIVQTALAAATFPNFPNVFHDPYYDMAIPLLRGGHVNGTLWNSAAYWPELLPYVVLVLIALVLMVKLTLQPTDATRAPAIALQGLAAAFIIGGQAWWGARLDFGRTLGLADVVNRMGYTCDADALRARLHQNALGGRRVPSSHLLELAFLRATSPCAELRDGTTALELAQAALRRTEEKNARAWDVLAAAYAEAGRFEEAEQAARRAVELCSGERDAELRAQAQSRLRYYQHRQPYRRRLNPR